MPEFSIEALKNGKKAVKITRTNENGELMDFDGVVFFRSPKRYSSYGKTPFFFVAHLGADGVPAGCRRIFTTKRTPNGSF